MSAARRPVTSPTARLVAATPVDRDRLVDAVRVGSLLVVVLGHWLMADVRVVHGVVRASNVLDRLPALHGLTWLLQVMPLFFVAGGFANATLWRRTRQRGDGYLAYLRERMGRLLTPVLVFALLAQGILGALWLAGAPSGFVAAIALAWGGPLWFLAVYVVVTAAAPAMHRWHARTPVSVLLVLGGVVVIADVARIVTGIGGLASANYLVVWLFAQQLGFWYADGRLARLPRGVLFAVVAAVIASLAVLTVPGPYPVSMVGVTGQMSNMSPPSICLVLLAVAQAAMLVLLRPRLAVWLARPRLWAGVVAIGAMAMTVYLWHLVALAAAAGAAVRLGVVLPSGGTVQWWVTRPLWLAAVAVALLVIAVPVSRLERSAMLHRRWRVNRGGVVVPWLLASVGLVMAAVGLAGYATSGLEPFGLPFLGIPASLLPGTFCLFVGWLLVRAHAVTPTRSGRPGSPAARPRCRRCRPRAPAGTRTRAGRGG